jgi:uncharacterized protein YeaC (DUF1315 family)
MAQASTSDGQSRPNAISFEDLKKVATQLGEEAGKGKDTRVKFQMKLVEAAFYNAVDLVENKHGKDKDDAVILTEAYVKAQGSSSYFDAKAPNQRKEISCARTAIKLGQWPNGGPGEPLQTMNNLMTTWAKERQKPENKGKLDDASNTLMRFARQQIKRDAVIDTAELRDLCFKKQPGERTVEQRLEAARKELTKLKELDNSSHIIVAINEITKRLKAIAVEKGKNQRAGSAKPAAKAGASATA